MSNKKEFRSIFKDELKYFIKYKKSLGFDYKQEVYRLKRLDNILYELKLKAKEISKETFYALVQRNDRQGENYARQYSVTKDFCKYLISNEYKKIYYEEKRFKSNNNYVPVLFNDDEIIRLFKAIDTTTNEHKDLQSEYQLYFSYSIIFRLLYACGLRISEVLRLKTEDVSLERNTINIIDSKRHISRLVVFSDSMKNCLSLYINKFRISDGLLFSYKDGKQIEQRTLRDYYKTVLKKAKLNISAHIHDLRHVFCNKAFNQMLEKGNDENVVMVYLYKYMGHKTFKETEYYIHFTDYSQNKIIKENDKFSKELYKGIDLNGE